MGNSESHEAATTLQKIVRAIFGDPKHLKDPHLFHKMALIPVLAWVGLGADGLSSSAYGPEEAFRALGEHTYLAVFLGLATALTVFIISYAYSRIIEHFPHGGGGYIVATHMLGEKAGVVSGSALLVDYVMTITISIASCCDAVFSYIPQGFHHYKVPVACILTVLLIILNIRGVKESIIGPGSDLHDLRGQSYSDAALWGLHPYRQDRARWQATYSTASVTTSPASASSAFCCCSCGPTPWVAVPTPVSRRSPTACRSCASRRVQTGKRTMLYMATSLAFTAGVLFLCYSLVGVKPVEGKTLNAVLADALFGNWPMGNWISFITIFSEGALLLVAAQAGFVDGPRVMSNMAIDSWFPHRFAALSVRLTMRNGILLMGIAAIALLFYTGGSVSALVVMYSINVFITFSLSQLGMSKFFIQRRKEDPQWIRHLSGPSGGAAALRHHSGHHDLREIRRRWVDDPADHLGGDRPLLPDQGALCPGQAGDEGSGRDTAGCAGIISRRTAGHRPQRPHRHPAGFGLQRLRGAYALLDPHHLSQDLQKCRFRLGGDDRFGIVQGGRGG